MRFIKENENKDRVGIYLIINKVNHKVYVGQTKDRFIERYWHHQWKLKKQIHDNTHLQKSWNKYGEENFEFSVIHILSNNENIDSLERYYIDLYDNSVGIYNIQSGGQDHTNKGRHLSEETKIKIGMANKIKSLGKKASVETKEKMSKAKKNKTQWAKCLINKEEAILIKQKILKGISPSDIAKELGIDYKIINNIYSSNTYKSAFVEGWEDFYKNRNKERKRKIPIEDREKIKERYRNGDTIMQMASEYGVDRNSIKPYII